MAAKRLAWLAVLLLTACDPTAFIRPLQEFKAANATLRDAYFQQLRVTRDARHENFAARRMVSLWAGAQPPKGVVDLVTADANKPALNSESLKIRQAAFDALDGYTGVLAALASGEDTAEIAADVKGLVGDFTRVLEAAKAIKGVTELATKAEAWLGPLQGIVDLFGTVFKLVSDYARDATMRKAVVAADKPINGLLELLEQEARYANDEARTEYASATKYVRDNLDSLSDSAKREAADHLIKVETRAKKLPPAEEVRAAFKAAREAQAALMRKAASPDYDELLAEMRAFKKTVATLKENLDAIERTR